MEQKNEKKSVPELPPEDVVESCLENQSFSKNRVWQNDANQKIVSTHVAVIPIFESESSQDKRESKITLAVPNEQGGSRKS